MYVIIEEKINKSVFGIDGLIFHIARYSKLKTYILIDVNFLKRFKNSLDNKNDNIKIIKVTKTIIHNIIYNLINIIQIEKGNHKYNIITLFKETDSENYRSQFRDQEIKENVSYNRTFNGNCVKTNSEKYHLMNFKPKNYNYRNINEYSKSLEYNTPIANNNILPLSKYNESNINIKNKTILSEYDNLHELQQLKGNFDEFDNKLGMQYKTTTERIAEKKDQNRMYSEEFS